MDYPSFIGGSSRNRSPNVSDEWTVNLYREISDGGRAKVPSALYRTPGVRLFTALGGGPVRGLFHQNKRTFAVGGAAFYEINQDRTVTLRGNIAADSRPSTMAGNGTNGNQVMVTSGGHGYIFDLVTNTLAEITDDGFPFPVEMCVFIDTYFVVLKRASNQFNWSSPLNGLEWNALDFAQTSLTGDQKIAIGASHRNLFVMGSERTEIWVSTPEGVSTFEPPGNTLIEHGIDAPFSLYGLDNTLYWVGRDEGGSGVVWRANGYIPERVSTHAIEYQLRKAQPLSDAIAYAYQDQGHGFYVLYVPTLKTTYVYDVTAREWHERALWNPVSLEFEPHVSRCHCFAWGKHLVGDRGSRAVYEMSLEFLTDEVVVPR